MDQRVVYVIIALLSALLYFLATGYESWPGCIIGDRCFYGDRGTTTGALLITAGVLVLLAGIFLIVLIALSEGWARFAAAANAAIAAILGIAGVFYFLDKVGVWSPFIATIAMSLTTALAATLLFDLISSYT